VTRLWLALAGLLLVVVGVQAQAIPGSPVVYYDFTGSARTATQKLESLVNVGTAPDAVLENLMTTADITADGALMQGDPNHLDGTYLPDKYMSISEADGSVTFPHTESGSMFIRFKPTSTEPFWRTYGLFRVGGELSVAYSFLLNDIDAKPHTRTSGGGGGTNVDEGPLLDVTTGATWDLMVTWDWRLDAGDTGESCMKIPDVATVCGTPDTPISGSPENPQSLLIGYLPDYVHGGEDVGAYGHMQVVAVFPTKLNDTEIEDFFDYVDSGSTPAASGHHPRLLRRLRVR
jgi:hypothetical protein